MTPQVSAGFAQTAWVAHGMSRRGALAIRRDDRADAGRRTTRVEPAGDAYRGMRVWFGGPVGLRAGESGAGIAPEPIDTRKKKESRAGMDRTLSAMQCPTLSAFFPVRHLNWSSASGRTAPLARCDRHATVNERERCCAAVALLADRRDRGARAAALECNSRSSARR